MIRLLIVDDHAETRQNMIKELTPGGLIQVIAEAETSDQGWQTASKLLPDMILLDTHMPGLLSTIDLLKRLTSLRRAKVVILGGDGKAADVQDLLEAGAAGYVLKTDPPALIRMTILMISKGSKGVISPSLPRHITRLSGMERSLLRQLTQRGGISKAAARLQMEEAEFDKLTEQLAAKLELAEPAELVKWAKKHGF